jgi:hypothetical protein
LAQSDAFETVCTANKSRKPRIIMSTDIERLYYYERQYLQSSDFTDEQTYHLEMRRRLNLALHLWGIVKGLELLQGEVIQGASNQFYVSEGMAIDAYGREIIVSTKHLLSGDLPTNRITSAGTYSVWIGYTRELTTPPQAGFQACNMTSQYTRWQESFEIIISPLSANPNPAEDPDPFGDLSDDPTNNPWLIHLGTINVDGSQTITAAINAHRRYIGLRTQRIVAPIHATSEFNVLDANAPLKPPTSIAVRDNLFLEQNLIAGSDFAVDSTEVQPSPPSTFPKPTGNVKIASDLFLQGNLYTQCDPTQPDVWMSLARCIQAQIPEIHSGSVSISLPQPTTVDSSQSISNTSDVQVQTQLAEVDTNLSQVTTSIAGITWISTPLTTTQSLQIDTSASSLTLASVNPSTYSTTIECTVSPAFQVPPAPAPPVTYEVPIKSVSISYIIILYPKTS